jgi:hypothetical protein
VDIGKKNAKKHGKTLFNVYCIRTRGKNGKE